MLTSLALIFLSGLALGTVFSKLKLPSLLGMLIAGMLLSPYALNLLDPSILGISADLRQLALVIILTRAGLSLSLDDLKAIGRPAVLMCFLPACFEMVGVTLLAPPLLGITRLEAALIGSVLAAVSPAVVVPRMIKLIEGGYGAERRIPQLILAGASVDDVFVIVVFTSFTALAGGGKVEAASFLQIPLSILFGILAGGAVGWVMVRLFRRFECRDTVKVLLLLSLSFLLIALEHRLEGIFPLSGLLAIMAMGIVFCQSYHPLALRLSAQYNQLWVAAEILLFVLVGATVDLNYALKAGPLVILMVLGSLAFRMAGVFCCLIKTPLASRERLFCMIAYTPKATVQAAIGGIPLALGLPCGQMVLTAAVLSILITAPFGAIGIDRTYSKLLPPSKGTAQSS
jgi:NhaP-type Na+/H+ or K+/H+ antiporter